jgi:hypothetical protein
MENPCLVVILNLFGFNKIDFIKYRHELMPMIEGYCRCAADHDHDRDHELPEKRRAGHWQLFPYFFVFLWEFCSRLDFFLFTKDSPRK